MTAASASKLIRLSVEYSVTEHCNIRCHACAHASPLLPEKFADPAQFTRDLEALATAFHAEQFRIVGGEPLLHPQLIDFMREARRIGIADKIVLYTNGVLLHRAPPELWQSIDALYVSAYPGIRRRLDDADCERLCREHGVALTIEHFKSFSQTLLGDRIDNPRLVTAIYRACHTATECHTVHAGRFYKCPMAPVMSSWLGLHGIAYRAPASDGVDLHDNPALRDDLERYLRSPTPLAACDYCLGTSGVDLPHRQLDRSGCQAWLQEDSRKLVDAVEAQLLPRGLKGAVRRVKDLLKGDV